MEHKTPRQLLDWLEAEQESIMGARGEYTEEPVVVYAKMAEVLRGMMWQPIETAPKNGMIVMGYWKSNFHEFHFMQPIKYLYGRWLVAWDHSEDVSPTHWMPLPEPPK